ncbi:OmpA family protein [Trichlorobacter ammonificans]|uniref:OmpA/MotB domain protein n=1 Tax=Trichlorobacter ammonificans TaxID=2916410 RepID=A0ABM9D4P8_9BACT|nr:OmpA family protein [Trichlorobacter ammonificans]CAH2030229.1 OmpA/MotB domain protein [Trichlorobacter ammonificans]
MQKKTRMLIGAAACAMLMQAGTVLAENRAETFTLSPYAGGYTYESKQKIETGPVLGARLGYNLTENWALEAILDYAWGDKTNGPGHAEKLRYGGDVLYNFWPTKSLVPYLAAGFGGMDLNDSGAKTTGRAVFNYGGGVKWFMVDDVALRADVRGLNYSIGDVRTNVQYTLGLHFVLGPAKAAPAPVLPPPPPVQEVEKPKAAPVVVVPPPAPSASLTATPGSVEAGKTVTLSWDSQNASGCEIQPGIGPVGPQGSRTVTPAADTAYTLVCKGEGGSADSSARVAVTLPPPVMEEGAGKKASAVAADNRLVLKIQFDTGKSVIKKQYFDELKEVGEGLNAQKNLVGVIEGHTDSVGSAASNMSLSQRRAKAVRDYIVKNFKVDGKRLTAKGYGETRPIADNATAEGRAQNRRIEAVFQEAPAQKVATPAAPAKKAVKKKAAAKKQ